LREDAVDVAALQAKLAALEKIHGGSVLRWLPRRLLLVAFATAAREVLPSLWRATISEPAMATASGEACAKYATYADVHDPRSPVQTEWVVESLVAETPLSVTDVAEADFTRLTSKDTLTPESASSVVAEYIAGPEIVSALDEEHLHYVQATSEEVVGDPGVGSGRPTGALVERPANDSTSISAEATGGQYIIEKVGKARLVGVVTGVTSAVVVAFSWGMGV